MDRPPYFAFYPADFANDINVEAMSTLQVGAYLLLLCKAWQAEPPASLPSDDVVLARLSRVELAVWLEIKSGVLALFRPGTDGRLHNKRLRQEYDKARKLIETKKRGGQLGADRRWHKNGSPNGSPIGDPLGSQCLANAIQSQIKTQNLKTEENPPTPHGGNGTLTADPSDQSKTEKPKPAESVPIPAALDTPDFRAAWSLWLDDRHARKKTVTERGAQLQLRKLTPLGPTVAIECIEEAVAKGWTGLVTDRVARPISSPGQPKPPGETALEKIMRIAAQMEADKARKAPGAG